MITESASFFGAHVAEIKKELPDMMCPILIARHVLERIGIDTLSGKEFTQFAQDLKQYNLQSNHHTGTHEEREIA